MHGTVGGNATVNGTLKARDYAFGAATPSYQVLKFRGNLTLGSLSETEVRINGNVRGTSYTAIDVAGDLALTAV